MSNNPALEELKFESCMNNEFISPDRHLVYLPHNSLLLDGNLRNDRIPYLIAYNNDKYVFAHIFYQVDLNSSRDDIFNIFTGSNNLACSSYFNKDIHKIMKSIINMENLAKWKEYVARGGLIVNPCNVYNGKSLLCENAPVAFSTVLPLYAVNENEFNNVGKETDISKQFSNAFGFNCRIVEKSTQYGRCISLIARIGDDDFYKAYMESMALKIYDWNAIAEYMGEHTNPVVLEPFYEDEGDDDPTVDELVDDSTMDDVMLSIMELQGYSVKTEKEEPATMEVEEVADEVEVIEPEVIVQEEENTKQEVNTMAWEIFDISAYRAGREGRIEIELDEVEIIDMSGRDIVALSSNDDVNDMFKNEIPEGCEPLDIAEIRDGREGRIIIELDEVEVVERKSTITIMDLYEYYNRVNTFNTVFYNFVPNNVNNYLSSGLNNNAAAYIINLGNPDPTVPFIDGPRPDPITMQEFQNAVSVLNPDDPRSELKYNELETAYINSNGDYSNGETICYDANGQPYVTTYDQISFDRPSGLRFNDTFTPTPDNPYPGMDMNDIASGNPSFDDEEGIVVEVDENGQEIRSLHVDLTNAADPTAEVPIALARAISKGVINAPEKVVKSVSDGKYRYSVIKPRELQQQAMMPQTMPYQQPYNPYGNNPLFTTNPQGYAVNVPMFNTNPQGYATNVPMFNTTGVPLDPYNLNNEIFQDRVLNGDLRNPYPTGTFFWSEWNRQVECIRIGVQQQIKYEYFDPNAYVQSNNGMYYYNPERAKEMREEAYRNYVTKCKLKIKMGLRMCGKEFNEEEFNARFFPAHDQPRQKTPEEIEDDKAWNLVCMATWAQYNLDQWEIDPYRRRAKIMQQYIYNYHQAFDHMNVLQFFNEEAWKIMRDIWIEQNVMTPRETKVHLLKKRLTQMPDLKHMASLRLEGPAVDSPEYKAAYENFRLAKAKNVMKLIEERAKGPHPVNASVVEDFLGKFRNTELNPEPLVDRSL